MAFSETNSNNAATRQSRWSSLSAPGGPSAPSRTGQGYAASLQTYSGGGPTGSGGYADQLSLGQPQTVSQALDLSTRLTGGAAKRPDSISGLDKDMTAAIQRMLGDAPPEIGQAIRINSAYRSPTVQKRLWQQALHKYGSARAARKWVAPPGRSQHNHGRAVDFDFGSDTARQWVHDNAENYGLNFRMSHEPWHAEFTGNASPREMTESPPINPMKQPRMGAEGGRLMMGYAPQSDAQQPFDALMQPDIPTPQPRPQQQVDIPAPRPRPAPPGFDVSRLDAANPSQPQADIPLPRSRPAPEGFDTGRFDAAEPGPTFDPNGEGVVVQAGDNLWTIAERHLGDGNRWQEIAQANGISDPNLIQPGQSLAIPGSQVASVPTPQPRPDRMMDIPLPRENPNRADGGFTAEDILNDPAKREQILRELENYRRAQGMDQYRPMVPQGPPAFVASNGVRIWAR